MSINPNERWEAQLQTIAGDFIYPPTPDLTSAVTQAPATNKRDQTRRRLQPVWVVLLLLVLVLAGTLSIPTVRATLLEWLQIGTIRIWLVELSPTPTAAQHQDPPTATALTSVLNVAGETTFDTAQRAVDFLIPRPTLPADLGEPDHVYLQQAEGNMVILVWMRLDQPDKVRMSLHLLGPGAFVWKMQPPDVVEVQMRGAPAFWTQGPYYIKVGSGQTWGSVRLVDGHVLIWTEGPITYRLESDLALADAIRVAESLRD